MTEPSFAVNVRELLRHPGAHKHVVLRHPLDDVATPVASVPPPTPILVDLELESVVEGILVSGQVSAVTRLVCARCLQEFERDLSVGVQELFALDARSAEEDGYAVLPDDRLPLDTMIRDALVLAFPSAPLHDPGCAGLCPQCGADRNVVDCGHRPDTIDPRWQALLSLRRTDGGASPAGTDRPSQTSEEEDDARPQA